MKLIYTLAIIIAPVLAVYAAEPLPKDAEVKETRIVVTFPEPIKQAMKTRMRRNLQDIHRIQASLAQGDFALAAEVSEFSLGLSSLGPHNARQAPYMPESMQRLGMEMHQASSRIAIAAQEGDLVQALDKLSQVTALCVACHATFRAK